MTDNIELIVQNAKVEIQGAKSEALLEQLIHKYLGNNGLLPRSKRSVQSLPQSFQQGRVRSIDLATRKLEKVVDKKRKEIKLTKNVKRKY